MGNAIEWYEFALFAYLAPVIGAAFFPHQSKVASVLAVSMVFVAGFLIRPLGSIVLGHMGDRVGRAATLKLTILLLSLSSLATGLLPTYKQAGIIAPAMLVLCRLLQGFCVGGEFAGTMIYLTESARSNRRALISSMTNNGSNIGVLCAILACLLTSHFLSELHFAQFGWRILFMIGGVLGITGLWLRRDITESDVFLSIQKRISKQYLPIRFVLKSQWKIMVKIVLLLFISAAGSYTLMGYISTYLNTFLNVPLTQAFRIQTVFIAFSLLFVPIFAVLSDRFGRRKLLLFSLLGYLLLSQPVFWALQWSHSWLVLMPLVILYSAEQAVTPVTMVEMTNGKGRYTCISMAYNISMALVGGTSPLINTYLIEHFKNNMIIAYYIMVCACVSLAVVWKLIPQNFGERLNLISVDDDFAR